MFDIGREHFKNRELNIFYRIYIGIFGAPEIGAKIRAKWALRILRGYSFKSILDAGCGRGYVAFQAARHYPLSQVYGLDIDDKKIMSCNALSTAPPSLSMSLPMSDSSSP